MFKLRHEVTKTGVAALLKEYGIVPNKALGQNFMASEAVLQMISDTAGISGGSVLEIGAGLGALTQKLLRAPRVVAVELDARLARVLREQFEGVAKNLTIVEGDILKQDLCALMGGGKVSVVANIPYHITTPIVQKLFSSGLDFQVVLLLMQKEAAQRLCATVGSKQYGAASALVQCHASAQILFDVPKESFYPQPDVNSALLKLEPLPPAASDIRLLGRVISAAFSSRRKTLENNLSAAFGITKQRAAEFVAKCSFSANIRGEALSPPQFITLANTMFDSL